MRARVLQLFYDVVNTMTAQFILYLLYVVLYQVCAPVAKAHQSSPKFMRFQTLHAPKAAKSRVSWQFLIMSLRSNTEFYMTKNMFVRQLISNT